VRSLRHAPAFALAAILTFAIGTGATSAVFTVLHGVLLKPLPYADPEQLVVLLHEGQFPVSPADFLDYRRDTRSYERVSAAQAWSATLATGGPAERLPGLQVSPDLFTTLGVPAALGRTFLPDEDQTSRDHVVVVSDRLWRERFGSDPGVVGRTITLDGEAYTVVGVMPPSFRFAPFWATTATLWRPLSLAERTTDRNGRSLRVFARLKPSVSREQAQAEASAIAGRLATAYPESNAQLGIEVVPLREKVVSGVRPTLWLLSATVALVLLVACVNVASLQLVRGSARLKELAVRTALGAGRTRLMTQLLAETVVLSVAGGIAGLLVATWAVAWIGTELPATSLPPHDPLGFSGAVAFFAVGVIIITGLASGLAPALHLSRADVHGALQGASRGATEGVGGRQLRRVLLGVELALALALLAGAGLMGRTLLRLQAVDPGFDPRNLLTFTVSLGGTVHDNARLAYFDRAAEAVGAVPGVVSASAINHLPLAGDTWHFRFQPEGRAEPRPGDEPRATWRLVRSGYFSTMRLPLVAGRDFDARDRDESLPVCIINETMARKLWPGQEAIGRRFRVGRNGNWVEVIGVAADGKYVMLGEEPRAYFYLPISQDYRSPTTLVVRSAGEAAVLTRPLQQLLHDLDSDLPVFNVRTMEDHIRDSVFGLMPMRMGASMAGIQGLVALLLAIMGLYAVVSYAVTRRIREIGVRLALGARPADIVRLVLREGMRLSAIGIVLGLVAAFGVGAVLSGILYGVRPLDIRVFAGVTALVLTVSALACYVPARRATRVDPLVALRYE